MDDYVQIQRQTKPAGSKAMGEPLDQLEAAGVFDAAACKRIMDLA